MLQAVPEEKMVYVVDMLKWMNDLFADISTGMYNVPASTTCTSPDALEAWRGFMKYKGTIDSDVDVKAELAKARDEKYAHFD